MASSQDNGTGHGSASLELPLLSLPTSHPCNECGACCRYIAVEIDSPTTYQDYDHIYWYLTHRSVAVYIDWDGDWYLEFETVCEHLTADATCGIYAERPRICSDFSWDTCEQTTNEPAFKARFEKPAEFMAWFETRRPKAYARYAAKREQLLAERAAKAAPAGSRRRARAPGRSGARERVRSGSGARA